MSLNRQYTLVALSDLPKEEAVKEAAAVTEARGTPVSGERTLSHPAEHQNVCAKLVLEPGVLLLPSPPSEASSEKKLLSADNHDALFRLRSHVTCGAVRLPVQGFDLAKHRKGTEKSR